MSPLWRKLNLKDQETVLVMGSPESFQTELEKLTDVKLLQNFGRSKSIAFVLAFVTKPSEIERIADKVAERCEGDIVLWFAYPKKTSKNYTCNFDRDRGWEPLGKAGFEGVRQIAIDDDWSALRFRRVEFIKTMKRNPKMAISKTGKARTKK